MEKAMLNPFENKVSFETKRGVEFHLMDDTVKGSLIRVWSLGKKAYSGASCAKPYLLDLLKTAVEVDVLKQIGIWKKLDKDVQDQITYREENHKSEKHERMALARSKRKKKYTDLPEMLVCACGASVKANYSYLQKKADAKKIPLQALVDGYQCQKCNPTKGRKKKKC